MSVSRVENNPALEGGRMNWIIDNCEWIFSGIGVVIFGWVCKLISCKRKADKGGVLQKSGSHSVNINAGRDVSYGASRKK